MANPEHLALLKRGVAKWNEWLFSQVGPEVMLHTKQHIRMDLTGADLKDADLRDVQFFETDLSNACLEGANLIGANFGPVRTKLVGEHAAYGATYGFIPAILLGTNLKNAVLKGATFESNLLENADFSKAVFGDTRLLNISLARAKGLEFCVHHGPSYLDYLTLQQSGILPLNFLRGCGLPDVLIDYLPSLLNHPVQFYSCFISFSSKDQIFADRLHSDLQNKGIRCWYAPDKLRIGDKFRARIEDSIRIHDKLLVILSENSIASSWVGDEVEAALERERRAGEVVLFPIRLDDAVMLTDEGWAASLRRARHIGDFSAWKSPDDYIKALHKLIHDLKPETQDKPRISPHLRGE